MGDGGRQVEALVKVEVDAESGLIDSEEPPQPAAVEEDHARVTIRKRTHPSVLLPSPRTARPPRPGTRAPTTARSAPDPPRPAGRSRPAAAAAGRWERGGGREPGPNAARTARRGPTATRCSWTPSREAISANGSPARRGWRACCRSESLPR